MSVSAEPGVAAMILAAGFGTRLRPLTDACPKAMVPVAGRPLIEYAVETVRRAGIERIVVNLHHHGEQIRDCLGDGERFGASILYSSEDPLQDSGGGIRDARRYLGETTFVTLNADTIVEVDLLRVLDQHRRSGATATMVLRHDEHAARYGVIGVDKDGRVGSFLGTPRDGADGPMVELMYTGVQVLEPRVFDYMPAQGPFSITRSTYPGMLAADEPVYGFRFSGKWLTVGTPQELAAAEASLAGEAH